MAHSSGDIAAGLCRSGPSTSVSTVVSSFASLLGLLLGPWAIVPSWLFFVILGNASWGGAVSPALLPEPFAFLSQWLPSGATVSALRNAIYFRDYQLARPLLVLGFWAAGLFGAWVLIARRRQAAASADRRRHDTKPTGPQVAQ